MMRTYALSILVFFSMPSFADHAVMSDYPDGPKAETVPLPPARPAVPKKKFECNRVIISGIASVYGLNNGSGDSSTQPLAGGGRLNVRALTAAMLPPQPLHTWVEVTNRRTGKKVVVYVNDRGPYHHGRVIDLTPAAARAIGTPSTGQGGTDPVVVRSCKKVG
jgi:rare lipoprotein A (peptidoglycan hydrolase)